MEVIRQRGGAINSCVIPARAHHRFRRARARGGLIYFTFAHSGLERLEKKLTHNMSRDVQIIAFSIFGPCCDDVIASALALQVGELWRQNSNLKRESTHFEGRRVDPGSEANF